MVVVADIEVPSGLPFGIVATWPDMETSQVSHFGVPEIPPNESGHATLLLQRGQPPTIEIQGLTTRIYPTSEKTETVAWDAPDVVWLVGILSGSDVAKGVVISLLAALLPTLAFVMVLYWANQYVKEPKWPLAAAFLWGAVPALGIAVFVRLFFRMPVDLLGPEAVEAVRAGIVAPLIEEALKGIVVVFIAVRFRREFDSVLDGIMYGAMVGLGFAMTGNILSYLGAFLLYEFAGLESTIIIDGVLFGLNHALYSAIFGAGLGYARLEQARWERWVIPLATFVFAVAGHASHNLAMRNAVGTNPLTVAVTWAGLLVMVAVRAWSMRQARRCLQTELKDLIPATLYDTVLNPAARTRVLWRVLFLEGYGAWRRTRRLHNMCATLTFRRMEARAFPGAPGAAAEVEALQAEIRTLMEAP